MPPSGSVFCELTQVQVADMNLSFVFVFQRVWRNCHILYCAIPGALLLAALKKTVVLFSLSVVKNTFRDLSVC
jgi:hypothetical protein